MGWWSDDGEMLDLEIWYDERQEIKERDSRVSQDVERIKKEAIEKFKSKYKLDLKFNNDDVASCAVEKNECSEKISSYNQNILELELMIDDLQKIRISL